MNQKPLTIYNPANGELIATVDADSPTTIAERSARARIAQKAWRQVPLASRIEKLSAFGTKLQTDHERLAAILSSEMGKPIRQATSEIQGCQGRFAFFLEQAAEALEPLEVHRGERMVERIDRDPLGLIANISAWNYPYFVGLNVIVPALLAGNAVLYKPSEHATLSGLEIVRAAHGAGIPEDLLQAVLGDGAVGAALLEQPLDGIFFTGSHSTGTHIAAAAARQLTKVQLELGGKDPAYAADDVDPEATARALAGGAFYNAGQSCCAIERIYCHEAIYEPFVEHFTRAVEAFRVGDPTDPETDIGPLARKEQRAVLDAQIADALQKGATRLLGDSPIAGPGNFYAPTVLVDVNHSMDIMRSESFGPVIGIQKVGDDEEAVQHMTDTPYGLTASVYTSDQARAETILSQLDTGTSYWNCCDRVSPRLPWSGWGHSGLGLTLSTEGIRTFTRPRAWHLRQH